MGINGKKLNDMKTLVTYFSCTSTTKDVAKELASRLGADIAEIAPMTEYSFEDLDWNDKQSRSSREMTVPGCRPPIRSTVSNMADYDVVHIGFPIWWYTAPTIINTFIERHDLKGKELHLFATSGGSTPEKALRDLRDTYSELNFVDATLF